MRDKAVQMNARDSSAAFSMPPVLHAPVATAVAVSLPAAACSRRSVLESTKVWKLVSRASLMEAAMVHAPCRRSRRSRGQQVQHGAAGAAGRRLQCMRCCSGPKAVAHIPGRSMEASPGACQMPLGAPSAQRSAAAPLSQYCARLALFHPGPPRPVRLTAPPTPLPPTSPSSTMASSSLQRQPTLSAGTRLSTVTTPAGLGPAPAALALAPPGGRPAPLRPPTACVRQASRQAGRQTEQREGVEIRDQCCKEAPLQPKTAALAIHSCMKLQRSLPKLPQSRPTNPPSRGAANPPHPPASHKICLSSPAQRTRRQSR